MLITMSDKEIQRLAVLQDVRDHRITQVRAAEILNLSTVVNGILKLTPFTLKMAK